MMEGWGKDKVFEGRGSLFWNRRLKWIKACNLSGTHTLLLVQNRSHKLRVKLAGVVVKHAFTVDLYYPLPEKRRLWECRILSWKGKGKLDTPLLTHLLHVLN